MTHALVSQVKDTQTIVSSRAYLLVYRRRQTLASPAPCTEEPVPTAPVTAQAPTVAEPAVASEPLANTTAAILAFMARRPVVVYEPMAREPVAAPELIWGEEEEEEGECLEWTYEAPSPMPSPKEARLLRSVETLAADALEAAAAAHHVPRRDVARTGRSTRREGIRTGAKGAAPHRT